MSSVQHAKPRPELRQFLHGYVQRVSEPNQPPIVEPVIARSGSMLEFQFREPIDVPAYGVDLPNPSVPITVIGPISARRVRLIMQGRVEAFTILFRALGLYATFGIPVSALAGTGTEGEAVLGAPIRALYQRLGNLRSFADRVNVVEQFLIQRLGEPRRLHPTYRALEQLAYTRAQLSVSSVAAQAGISTRQLERMSLENAGVSPRMLTRLARFQEALGLKQAKNQMWTLIAHAANYHDQMHMIRDFREFAGNTPERVMTELSPEHLISFMCL